MNVKRIILPRQAHDKPREKTFKKLFSAGGGHDDRCGRAVSLLAAHGGADAEPLRCQHAEARVNERSVAARQDAHGSGKGQRANRLTRFFPFVLYCSSLILYLDRAPRERLPHDTSSLFLERDCCLHVQVCSSFSTSLDLFYSVLCRYTVIVTGGAGRPVSSP